MSIPPPDYNRPNLQLTLVNTARYVTENSYWIIPATVVTAVALAVIFKKEPECTGTELCNRCISS